MRYPATPVLIAVLVGSFAAVPRASAAAPVITSGLTAVTVVVVPGSFSYKIAATDSATWFNAVPLVDGNPGASLADYGLAINRSTGVISGFLKDVGSLKIAICAKNASGTGLGMLTVQRQSVAWVVYPFHTQQVVSRSGHSL